MSTDSLISHVHNPVKKRTLIVGPMGAGKTSELAKWVQKAGMEFCDKPRDRDLTAEDIMNVYDDQVMVIAFDENNKKRQLGIGGLKLHTGLRPDVRTYLVTEVKELLKTPQFTRAKVVFVDEGQFICDLPALFHECFVQQKDLIVAGLDKDINSKPFPSIVGCFGLATNVVKLEGRCEDCSKPSRHTISRSSMKRQDADSQRVVLSVGGFETYKTICDDCLILIIDERKKNIIRF